MSSIVRSGIAAILGAIFGVAVSWIVNCTLVEISLNSFFGILRNVVFINRGIIFWRIFAGGPAMGQPCTETTFGDVCITGHCFWNSMFCAR